MLRFELSRKEIRVFYGIIISFNLLFMIMNSPFLVSQLREGGVQSASILDFVKYQFDLKREGVFAAWYSGTLLFITGLIATLISRVAPSVEKHRALHRAGWTAMALLFFALSADEVSQIHEQSQALYHMINPHSTVKLYAGDWIPVLMPLIAIITVGLILFAALVLSANRLSLVLAAVAITCWIGAIFAETFEAGLAPGSMSKAMEGLIEESLEIVGTTLFCASFLEFLKKQQTTPEPVPGKLSKKARKEAAARGA